MSNRLKQLLISGKITKAEYDRRLSQSKTATPPSQKPPKPRSRASKNVQAVSIPYNSTRALANVSAQAERRMASQINGIVNRAATNSGIPKSQKGLYDTYLRCAVDNSHCESRYPDSFPRKTAIFTSTSPFTVPITIPSGESEGRFSFAIQPIMGDITDPTHYQAAVVNIPSGTAANYDNSDFSAASSYSTLFNGRDVRVDINGPFLANGSQTGYHASTVVANPALAQPNPGSTTGQNFVGPSVGVMGFDPVFGNLNVLYNADGSFTLPSGSYTLELKSQLTLSDNTQPPNIRVALVSPDSTAGDPSILRTSVTAATSYVAGTPFNITSLFFISTQKPQKFYASVVTGLNVGIAANKISNMTNQIFVMPGPSLAAPGGIIELIRPVAQTVLVSYMGARLTDGGRIVSAYVPRGLLETNYFSPAPNAPFGALQKVENLAALDDVYDGSIRDGTYAWWSKFDDQDSDFLTIPEMNAKQWPAIVVSGIYNPGQVVTGVNDNVRVIVWTTFEIITKSTALDSQVCAGSQAIIDRVNQSLANQPHCLANGFHLEWLGNFLKTATGSALDYVVKNPATVAKLAGTALAFL